MPLSHSQSHGLTDSHSLSHSRLVLVSWSRSFGRWDSRGHTRLLSLSRTHTVALSLVLPHGPRISFTVSRSLSRSLPLLMSRSPTVLMSALRFHTVLFPLSISRTIDRSEQSRRRLNELGHVTRGRSAIGKTNAFPKNAAHAAKRRAEKELSTRNRRRVGLPNNQSLCFVLTSSAAI